MTGVCGLLGIGYGHELYCIMISLTSLLFNHLFACGIFIILCLTRRRLGPALLLLPGSVGLVDVDLSAGLCRIAEVKLFHLFGLDDNDSKVLSCDRVVQVLDFCAESQVLVIVGLRSGTARWGRLERTLMANVSIVVSMSRSWS